MLVLFVWGVLGLVCVTWMRRMWGGVRRMCSESGGVGWGGMILVMPFAGWGREVGVAKARFIGQQSVSEWEL